MLATVRGQQEQELAQALLDRLYRPMSLRRQEGIQGTDHPQHSERWDPLRRYASSPGPLCLHTLPKQCVSLVCRFPSS
jgi:hypothetical protein